MYGATLVVYAVATCPPIRHTAVLYCDNLTTVTTANPILTAICQVNQH